MVCEGAHTWEAQSLSNLELSLPEQSTGEKEGGLFIGVAVLQTKPALSAPKQRALDSAADHTHYHSIITVIYLFILSSLYRVSVVLAAKTCVCGIFMVVYGAHYQDTHLLNAK